MISLPDGFFFDTLDECRMLFDRGPARLFGLFGPRVRKGFDRGEDVTDRMKPQYQVLAEHGQVVWGSIVQANNKLFQPGNEDLPGVTVYSRDSYFDGRPEQLFAIASAGGVLKNTNPADTELSRVASRLTDEYDLSEGASLPKRLTGGRELTISTTIFHRARLPITILSCCIFPIVIAPDLTPANMVLQLQYWPMRLRKCWDKINELLVKVATSGRALEVVRSVEMVSGNQTTDHQGSYAAPVYVTPAGVAAYHAYIKQLKLKAQLYLMVSIGPDGKKQVDLAFQHDPRLEYAFQSNGIPVVVLADQRERLRGAVVDFRDITPA